MTPSPSWQAPRSPASTRPPGSCSGMRIARRTPSRTRSSVPGVICPRCATRTDSTPGCVDSLVNACIDEIRRVRRRHLDVDITDLSNPPSVADAASAIADRDQLERAFSRLEPEERAVIVLHHYLDLPLPEVAATLADPAGHDQVPPVPRAQGDARGARRRRSTRAPTSERGARHEPRATPSTATSPTGSTRMPSTGCRSTSMPSCGGPGRSASARHGRASKGGSPWTRHFALESPAPSGRLAAGRPRPDRRPRRWRLYRRRVALNALPAPFGPARNGASSRAMTAISSPSIRDAMPSACRRGPAIRLRPDASRATARSCCSCVGPAIRGDARV